MTQEELKSIEVAKTVDARGTACPGPLLEAKKAIGGVGVSNREFLRVILGLPQTFR